MNYIYDAGGRLWKVTDPENGVTEYTYDSSDRMLTIKDPRGIVFLTNEYDANGRVMNQTQADTTTYQFAYTLDSNGKVTETDVTNPRGYLRRVAFSASGYMITDTSAVGTPEQQTITYERQPLTNFVLNVTEPLGRRIAYAYDAFGNVTDITRLAGTTDAVTTEFTYEPVFNQVASVTDPLDHTIALEHDSRGSVTSVTDPLNHQSTFTYNASGQPISAVTAENRTTQFGYTKGDPSSVTNPLGLTSRGFTDSAGRLISLTSPLGHTARVEHNLLNRVTRIVDPLQGATSFAYDPNGNLLDVTDPRNNVTSYTYDSMDRVATRKDPLLREESYQYDANGNLRQVTDRKSQPTNFTYDALDRLTQVTYADGSSISYTYDAGNRLTQVVDSVSGTITFGYDNLDRVTSETTPQGIISYTYDAADRLISMTVAGQPAVNYTYDNADRLTQITQGSSTVTIAHDAADRRASLTLPNGVVAEYSYDAASRLSAITYKKGALTLGDLTYEHDAAGQVLKMGGSFARTGLPQAVTSASYDAANQQTGFGAQLLTYDANGNLSGDGTNTYTWNVRDQLVSMNGPGLAASFQYDALGRRISKTINGAATSYLYDGAGVVQEQVGGTASATIRVGGIDELLTRTDPAGTSGAIVDGLGSVIALTDSTGAVQTQYSYEPFGKTTVSGAASGNPAQYTGRENDGTGLYYYRVRYYSPTLQRFIAEDPIGLRAGDVNFYSYVGNSPTNWVDPLGFDRENGFLDRLQGLLDYVGFAPVYGDLVDLGNAVISDLRGNEADANWRLLAAVPVVGSFAAAGKIGKALTREKRLIQLLDDFKVSSADRGWIRNEIRQVQEGNRCTIRNPPGKDLRHPPGRPKAQGFDYSETQLQDRATHRSQHRYLVERSSGTTIRRP